MYITKPVNKAEIMATGKMNRRITLFNEGVVIDAGGGTSSVETERWDTWAEIADRTGNTYAAQATELTRYDYRVKVRFDGRITSKTMMIYEGQVCSMGSVTVETEGRKNYLILRVARTETWVDVS